MHLGTQRSLIAKGGAGSSAMGSKRHSRNMRYRSRYIRNFSASTNIRQSLPCSMPTAANGYMYLFLTTPIAQKDILNRPNTSLKRRDAANCSTVSPTSQTTSVAKCAVTGRDAGDEHRTGRRKTREAP